MSNTSLARGSAVIAYIKCKDKPHCYDQYDSSKTDSVTTSPFISQWPGSDHQTWNEETQAIKHEAKLRKKGGNNGPDSSYIYTLDR